MDNSNNEERTPAVDNGLQNLPAAERKETEEILAEIEGDKARAAGEEKKPEDVSGKPEEKKPEDGKQPDEGKEPADGKKPEGEKKPGEEDGKKPEPRREMKLVPAWVLERERDAHAKREKELLDAAAAAGKPKPAGEEEDDKAKPEASAAELDKAAEALAEKHGITAELAKDLIIAARAGEKTLPTEVVEKLRQVDALTSAAEIEAEATKYNADFDRLIVPLVKAEYGDDVPPQVLSDIREQLKELAYNPDFAKVPYSTLYKGEDKFRGLVAPAKRGAEPPARPSPSGGKAGEDGKPDLTKQLSDAEIRALSPEDFDTYSANMEKAEGKGRK